MNNVDLDFNLPLVSQKKKKKILFCLLNYSIKKKSKHNAIMQKVLKIQNTVLNL